MGYICQCGCGEEIPDKAHHRYRPPRYIQSHWVKMKDSLRTERMREAQAVRREKPPEGWTVPSGICECGCGNQTKIATVNAPKRDQFIGYPMHYLPGHSKGAMAKGADLHTWRGGRFKHKTGYIYIYAPEHPAANAAGYVFEHRLVYEKTHGVVLTRRDVIHHVNAVRDDNAPENLVRTTQSEHSRDHDALGEWRAAHPDEVNQAAREAGRKGAEARWGNGENRQS